MVARHRLYPGEIIRDTPAASVASGRSTPTLDGCATPTGTVFSDENDTDCVAVQDIRDESSFGGPSGIQPAGRPEARSGAEHTGNGEAGQASGNPPEPNPGFAPVRDMHGYTGFGLRVLLVSIAVMTLWSIFVSEGSVITLSIRVGRGADGATTTKTVHVPRVETIYHTLKTKTTVHVPRVETSYHTLKTKTSVQPRTHTITTTAISTKTVSATKTVTAPSKRKKGGLYSQRTVKRWEPGSGPVVKCDHGNTHIKYHRFLSRREKLQRQYALSDCLGNLQKGIRWTGVDCGRARWEVKTDPHSGGIYSDPKRCWQRCDICLSGAIKALLGHVECVVEDRGSRCVARFAEVL